MDIINIMSAEPKKNNYDLNTDGIFSHMLQ